MKRRPAQSIRAVAARLAAVIPALVAVLLVSGCSEKPVTLRIYFTADDSGFLTPCG